MVADLIVVILPGIQMQVLILGVSVKPLAHIHVIQLLRVHIKQICVSLNWFDPNDFVEISEAGYLSESGKRVNLGVLVKVARNEDISRRVLAENLGNKFLSCPC